MWLGEWQSTKIPFFNHFISSHLGVRNLLIVRWTTSIPTDFSPHSPSTHPSHFWWISSLHYTQWAMFAGSPVLLQCSNIRTIWPLHIRSRCSCSANFHHLWLRPPVRFWTRTSAGGNRTAHYWKVNNKHVRTIKKIALDVFIAGYLIQFRRMRSTICCTPSQICIFRPWGGPSQVLLLSGVWSQ